jgi:RNA polymerase sigma-70 factor (ECF subfamily)
LGYHDSVDASVAPDRDPVPPSIPSLSDEDLMARVAEDDERAFTELVRRFQGRVTNLIARVLNDRESSDDLAQEVFVRVFVHRRNYRRGSKFTTWLFTIAANLAKNEIRRRVRKRNWFSLDALQELLSDSAAQLADPTEGQEPALQRAQLQEAIGRAIATVPEKYRVALVLRDIEGFAYEEIGQMLRIPGGTVRSRINRARAMLKRKLRPLLRKDVTP